MSIRNERKHNQRMEKKERLYTLPELQKILELPTRAVQAYIRSGELSATWSDGTWKVKKSALDEFLGKA